MANAKISKKIQELIKTATPKQKAIIVCRDWVDKNQIQETPLLTEEEAKAIIDSLTPEEGKEYNKWIRAYNVYAEVAPIIGLAIAQYREQAEEIVGYLRVLESYAQEENHLNMIYEAIKDSKSKTALSTFDAAIKNLRFQYAGKTTRDEEGYIEIETESLYSLIREKIKQMGWAMMALKAFIISLDEWTDKHKSKKLLPPTLSGLLDDIKADTIINVPSTYSRRLLKDRIRQAEKRGETYTPTIAEQKKAIFPCYEEMPEDKEFIEMWSNRIAQIENSLKNGK